MDDASGPRRFSINTALLPQIAKDIPGRKPSYAAAASESDPLLGREDSLGQGAVEEATSVGKESRLLFKYSLPLTLTYLLQYSFSLVTVFVVGHIGTDELGAVSLASMTANITGYAVYEGLTTSLDTLCAQAYGSNRKQLVGLHLQRMTCLLFLVTIPIGLLWIFSGPILAALVPERELAYLAGSYLRILLAGTPGYFLFEAGKRFTQAQGIFSASLWVLIVCTPINIVLNYVFVFVLHWGLTGAALAVVISNSLLPICLLLFVVIIKPSSLECWGGFTKQAFKHWGPMVKLALPGIIMVEAEWLAFDILTFSSSYISTAALAAQSVVMTICVVMFHIPFSVSVAVSTRLGNLIGSGALTAAKTATKTYAIIFVVMGLIDAAIMVGLKDLLPRAFSSDTEVIRLAAEVMPVLAAFQLFDATTALVNGLLRGLGRQNIGGYANLFVYYLIAVPLALFLCFGPAKWELAGLWTGCVVGSALITVTEGLYVVTFNWEKAVEDARMREE